MQERLIKAGSEIDTACMHACMERHAGGEQLEMSARKLIRFPCLWSFSIIFDPICVHHAWFTQCNQQHPSVADTWSRRACFPVTIHYSRSSQQQQLCVRACVAPKVSRGSQVFRLACAYICRLVFLQRRRTYTAETELSRGESARNDALAAV